MQRVSRLNRGDSMNLRIYRDLSCAEHCTVELPNSEQWDVDLLKIPCLAEPLPKHHVESIVFNLVSRTFMYRNHLDFMSRVLLSELQNNEVYEEGDLIGNRLLVLRKYEDTVHYPNGRESKEKYLRYDLLDGEKTITNYPFHPWCCLVEKLPDGTGKWKMF